MKQGLLILLIIFIGVKTHAGDHVRVLNTKWQFREKGTDKWREAEVPGTVHTDLMRHKIIPDPFYRDNESKVQWVEEKSWEYRTSFNLEKEWLEKNNLIIEFDGLDTYAEVYLNTQLLFKANNMFLKWEYDIRPLARKGKNELLVIFYPSALIAKKNRQEAAIDYPDNERIFVRKAQYQFGWDWGPRLVTAGIWKDVRIRAFDERKAVTRNLSRKDVQLIREQDRWGESFYFQVDGKPMFIKGVNWVPADNFLPRAKKLERYVKLVLDAKAANINMLRVWGGGVYEDNEFYEVCNLLGMLVWQDFMFAGAMYPASDSFLKNIETEVRQQVLRLRDHPCIVIWCGNNEIEEAWFNWGWQKEKNYSAADSLKLWNDYRKIFHELIPGILKELDPERPYWPSSPSLGWGRDSAYKKGDVHYWGVWWGREPVEKYREKVGRFNSEYGMQGIPSIRTVREFALESDLDTTSAVMKAHQKHPFGYDNIRLYIRNKFPAPGDFILLTYVSQLMQADAIKIAIEAHRSNMPYTMGTMFWQWNDCWPVVSWSAIDYYGRKKALYYQVKRSFAEKAVFTSLKQHNLVLDFISDDEELDAVFSVKGIYFDGRTEVIAEGIPVRRKIQVDLGQFYHSGELEKKLVYVEMRDRVDGSLIGSAHQFFLDPKDLALEMPDIKVGIHLNSIVVSSDVFAYGVMLDVPDGVKLEDNFFHLLPGEERVIKYSSTASLLNLMLTIRHLSLADAIH